MARKPSRRNAPAPPPSQAHLILPVAIGIVLAVYVAGILLLCPAEGLPYVAQRAVGLGLAVLGALFFLAATRQRKPPELLVQRVRLAERSDFGKQLHTLPSSRELTVRLPWLGRVKLKSLGALGLFLAVSIGWWLSPWPIRVKTLVPEDMTVPLAEEIVAPVLVLANPHLAVLAPPMVPQRARQLAGLIPDTAGPEQLALRELGREHFEQARAQLARARHGLIEAELAMFAGRFSEAVTLYGQLAEQRRDDPLLLCQWAAAMLQAGQFEQAGEVVERALSLSRKGSSTPSAITAACLHVRALVMLSLGRNFNTADADLSEGAGIWKELVKKEAAGAAARLAASQNNRAALSVLRGDFVGAEELFNTAHDLWSRAPGEQDPHLVAAWDNLAMLQCLLGRQGQAQQALKQAAKSGETLAKDHPLAALTVAAAGTVQREGGHYAEARADAKKALAAVEKSLGGEHPLVAALLENLMAVNIDEARYAEAYASGSRSGSLIKQLWGAEHPYLAMNRIGLAEVEIGEGQVALARGQADAAADHFAKADALCQEALPIIQRAFGPKSGWLAELQYTRGRLEIARNAPEAAQPFLDEARKSWAAALGETLGDDYPPSIRVLGDLASLDDTPPLLDGAVRQAQGAVELARRVCGSDHPEVARLLCILAVLQRQKKDYDAAIKSLDEALEIRKHRLPASHPDLAATLTIYASVLRKMDPPQNDKAADLEAQAKKILAAHAAEDRLK